MKKISEIKSYINEFGFHIFSSKVIRKVFYKSNSKLAWKINDYNEKIIEKFLKKEFAKSNYKITNELNFFNDKVPKNPIWIMWWQGIENAPEIVKCCINSVKKNKNNHEVIIITENNFKEYLNLPNFIYKKFQKGYISKTHLSDLIRLNLLYLYGGLWLDATVFVSQKIPEYIFNKEFYSINFGIKTKDPSHGRWTTFCMGCSKKNRMIKEVLINHYKFWNKHNIIVDYIMFDYMINIAIQSNELYLNYITTISKNNVSVFKLFKILNCPNNKIYTNKLDKNTFFYKLSYKHELFKEINSETTIYGKIVEKYIWI